MAKERIREVPYLKGNLHTHTVYSDGANFPQEVLNIYEELGYDFVAITDHDYLIRPHYWKDIPEQNGNLLVFKGVELEYAPLHYQHIGKIIGDQEVLFVLNHPQQYRLSIPEINRQIALISLDMPIHAIEVTDKGVYTPLYDAPEILLSKIAADDAHSSEQYGQAWIEVNSPRDRDSILRAIKAENFRMGFKEGSRGQRSGISPDPSKTAKGLGKSHRNDGFLTSFRCKARRKK
jgi:hypothetical protein